MNLIKNIRLKKYDYSSNGSYFITLCTYYKQQYLVSHKELIEKEIKQLNMFKGVCVDCYCIMPNHLHIILDFCNCSFILGEIIRKFKASTSRQAHIKLWQPNYYEHIIRNEKALFKIREYIQNNPLDEKFDLKKFY